MNQTLADLLAALASDLGYEAIPSVPVTTRLTRYLNEGYRHLLSMSELSPLRLSRITFTSAPGQTLYGVPQALVQIHHIVDPTSAIRLRLMTLDEFRTIDPQSISSGTPTHYIPVGLHPVQRDPSHTDVWAASDAAADTTQTVTIWGVSQVDALDTSVVHTTGQALQGLTPVLVATGLIAIQKAIVHPATTGSVSLFDSNVVATAHRLAWIPVGSTTIQYQGIRLWPTPADTREYQVDGELTLTDLVASYESSLLPTDFEYILTDYARMREYEYRDDSRAPLAAARYAQKLQQFRNRIMNPPDYRPRVGRFVDRGSNLGPYFPSGRF